MDLSIIILNYKTKGLVKYCLNNIKANTLNLAYEIIVVDNGSNDGCGQMMAEQFPDIKFLQLKKNSGFAAGNNVGIKEAKGKYIMLINPDAAVLDNSIEKMVAFMEQHPDVGLAGPKLLNPDGSYQISCRTFQTPKLVLYRRTPLGLLVKPKKELDSHLMRDFDHNENRAVDWVMGACMLVRKSALEKVGLLDERFFFYVEDMDWCRRFWQNGFKVYYIASAQMYHLFERASETDVWGFFRINKMARCHISSWIKYFIKYLGQENHAGI